MHRERYIKNTVFLTLTSLVAQVVTLFVLPLFITNLGKEMYGIFVISSMLTGYLGLLDFGFTDGIARYIGQAYARKDAQQLARVVAAGVWLLAGIGLVAAGLIYFGRFAIVDFFNLSGDSRVVAANLLAVTALFSVLQWPMRMPGSILRATLHIREKSIVDAATSVVTSFVMLALVYMACDVVTIRIGVFLVSAASWLPRLLLVRRCVPELRWHPFLFRLATLRDMSSFSLGMFYTRLLSMLATRIDLLLIGRMISVGAIIPYVVASRLFHFVRGNASHLMGPFLPTVFNLDTEANRHKLQTLLNDGVRYRALLVTPLAYLGIVISPAFIRTWMGQEYVQYAVWSQLFVAVHLITVFGIGTNIARGTGRLRWCNALLTIRIAANVILSIALIPRFGIGGPILGTVLSSVILGDIVAFPLFCRMCNLSWRKPLVEGLCIIGANMPISLGAYFLVRRLRIDSWGPLLLSTACLLCVFYGVLYLLFIRDKEKRDVYTALEATGITRLKPVGMVLQSILLPS